MRQRGLWLVASICFVVALVACYGRALRGEQFGYRDAAHYYYPLHLRVQQEWDAGRWPLWEPEENSGMPLLGNPTAAVLYPGKLVFALAPYPLAARWYVIGHTLLAFLTTFLLLRSWGTGVAGASVAALAYGFGGPILFQYCNIIYLVGAAWAPLGLHAADAWLRQGRRWALLELGVVLALETLGGDPEIAYLTGLCAGGYALLLARSMRPNGDRTRLAQTILLTLLGFVGWVLATLVLARFLPGLRPDRPPGQPTAAFAWMPWVGPAVVAGWAALGLRMITLWWRERGRGERSRLEPMLAGLAVAAVLAGLLAGAQLLPVFEFTGMSVRAAGEGPHEIYTFSLHPLRLVEFLWPNVFGTPFHGNRYWVDLLPTGGQSMKIWVPSLYLGGVTFILACGAACWKHRPEAPWRSWLTAIALISVLGSFGEYTSPIWWARFAPIFVERIGPHDDDVDVAPIRRDKQLRDGDGSLYWTLATVLPGFKQFRFPSKLLTFTSLALAALAGMGLDQLLAGDPRVRRRALVWAGGGLLLSLVGLSSGIAGQNRFMAWLRSSELATSFGPLDAAGAWRETCGALAQGAVVCGAVIVLALISARRPRLAAAFALVLTTADLAAANARFVLTVPQAVFDEKPRILRVIEEAERANPSPSPYRVYRLPSWSPVAWNESVSEDRVRDFVEWEHDTLQPKHGITQDVHFTYTIGVSELYDYAWFFGPFLRAVHGKTARTLNVKDGDNVIAYSRRTFDLWGSRYFVLPAYPGGWKDEHRGYATFLELSERIYPKDADMTGANRAEKELNWARSQDVQVFRNLSVYPRAWIVHERRVLAAMKGLDRDSRNIPMQEILYSRDFLWHEEGKTVYDPRQVVWVEPEDGAALAPFSSGGPTGSAESVTLTRYEPQRVELTANLDRPGIVVLADVYYPGWRLTIDGQPAPLYRANRMMRGAALLSGKHTLVYTFHPQSFRVGLVLSALGCVTLFVFAALFALQPSWRTAEWGRGEARDL